MPVDARTQHNPDHEYLAGLIAQSGLSERETAFRLGVDRMSLRRWLGKKEPVKAIPYTAQVALEQLAAAGRRRKHRIA